MSETYTPTCHESQLVELDAAIGQVRQAVQTTALLRGRACTTTVVRLTEPPPPAPPAVELAGRRVTLRWPKTLGAPQYEPEAGTAPGQLVRGPSSVRTSRGLG